MIGHQEQTKNTSRPNSLRRTLASGLILNLLSNLLLYLGHLIIARRLPRDDYAVFIIVVSFVSLMALFADLGLTLLFVRKFAAAEANSAAGKKDVRGELLGSMLVLRFGMAIIVSLVVMIISPLLGYSLETRQLMMIMLVTLFISSRLLVVRSVGEAFLRGHNKYHLVALFAVVDAIVFSGALYFYSDKVLDLEGAVWIYSFCHIPGFLFLFGIIYRFSKSIGFKLRFNFHIIKTMLTEGFPLILSTAFLTIHSQADALLIDKFSTAKEVSAFGAGLRVLTAVVFLPGVFTAVIGPLVTQATVTQEFEKIRSTIDRSLRLLLVSALFIAISFSVSSELVVYILFGENKYMDAAPLVLLFGWAFIPICFSFFITDIAIAEGRFWIPTLYASIIMISSILCDILLIPHYGALGAVMAKCISVTIGSVVLLAISEKLQVLARNKIMLIFLKLGAIAACSLGTIYLLSFIQLNLAAVICIVAVSFFFSAVLLVKIISFQEIWTFFRGFFRTSDIWRSENGQ
jgi:O-antigen/teichoic acid export membrane protein